MGKSLLDCLLLKKTSIIKGLIIFMLILVTMHFYKKSDVSLFESFTPVIKLKLAPPHWTKSENRTTPTSKRPSPAPKKPPPAPKRAGIPRSQDEQHKEAVEILSLALENAVAKHRQSIDIDPDCDWAEGSWVKDDSIKYGKDALSGYGKCHVDNRQNCKRNSLAYLGYRWVLKNKTCEANRTRFTRERFLETVRNKKIVFIGDSLTRNMFQSLACLLYVRGRPLMIEDNMYRYRYPNFGVTIEFIVSNYLVKQTRTNCNSDATVKLAKEPCLDLANVDPKWASRVKDFDIFLFATGGWWEHDVQMRQASNGAASYRKSKEILHQALKTVTDYLGRPEFKNKELYWRCSEVSHFYGGEWNTGGTCLKDSPSEDPQYNAVSLFIQEAVIHSLVATSSNISILDITKMSGYRQDAHPSSRRGFGPPTDCKHWCLPGVTDHWNEIWMNMLKKSYQKKS